MELPERQRAGSSQERALLIVATTAGSPAEAAGVLVGDILLQFDGSPVQSTDDLLDLLAADRAGRTVPLALLRGGAPLSVQVTVGAREAS